MNVSSGLIDGPTVRLRTDDGFVDLVSAQLYNFMGIPTKRWYCRRAHGWSTSGLRGMCGFFGGGLECKLEEWVVGMGPGGYDGEEEAEGRGFIKRWRP